jgi:mono/diheme cytochrome c family protein
MLRARISSRWIVGLVPLSAALVLLGARTTEPGRATALAGADTSSAQLIARGRYQVLSHGCGGCHGGVDDPSAHGWLAGVENDDQVFEVGACNALHPDAKPCFKTYPRNLTPDNETGLGRFTERQIFNALRYGLRPEETPDVEITSTTPGQGNFPMHPRYLAPPMPWPDWRHMDDSELWAIAAYLKRAVKPVHNRVPESEGPPDFWASAYAKLAGPYPAKPFPTENERAPDSSGSDK